jgi:tetratricopeptide (TPR) repeat protein
MSAHRSSSVGTRSAWWPALPFGLLLPLVLVVLGPATAAAQDHHHHDADEVGVVDFRVSCDPAVRTDFDRSVALLHHMMYPEARQGFERVAEQDPSCGMAHWGIAMALFQPIWPGRPSAEVRRQGWEAVQRAKELGIGTDREQALVAAVEAFYQDPERDEWWPRIRRWSSALEEAYRAEPDDPETAAFYALSLMAVAQGSDDLPAYHARAAEVLHQVHRRESLHPGGIHYTIHADDIAGREGESLDVVRMYDRIAPSVPHALHMPSHIFVRLGAWPDVIDWNRRSADAALRFPAGDRLSVHFSHALDYMLYAYLQRGEDARAGAVMEEIRGRDELHQENFVSAFHLAVMPARFAVERRAWDEASALEPRSPDYLAWDRYWWPEALSWFARGLGAVHTGDLERARASEHRMMELRDLARSADEANFATYIEVDRLILSGWLAQAAGDGATAEALMREAAELEGTVQKHVVTPGALLPPNEALGDLFMEQGRPADALAAFERSLEIWPDRYNSLVGAARAAVAADDLDRARAHYARLLEVTAGSGSDRAGVREARQYQS